MKILKRLKAAAGGRGTRASRRARALQLRYRDDVKFYGGLKFGRRERGYLVAWPPLTFNTITPTLSWLPE